MDRARTGVRTMAAVALALLLAAACSGDDGADSAGVAREDAAIEADPGGDGASAPADAEVAAGAALPDVDLAAQAATEARQVISTATLTVEVDDLDAAGEQAAAIAVDAGGYVAGEETDRGAGAASVLTLKVEPAEFGTSLDALAELGDLRTQSISTDDVTDAIVDLESRIATAEASVERLRALTEEAGSIPDLTTLESELLARETTLEQLRGEQRTLEDRVALATITVTLTTEDGGPVVPEDDDRDLPTFLGGLEAGWDVLVTIVAVALAVLGFLLPFLVPAALVAVVVLAAPRRRRRSDQAPDVTSAAPPGSAQP